MSAPTVPHDYVGDRSPKPAARKSTARASCAWKVFAGSFSVRSAERRRRSSNISGPTSSPAFAG